jgi:hypothetical protein
MNFRRGCGPDVRFSLFYPDGGGNRFLRNVINDLLDYRRHIPEVSILDVVNF